MNLQRGFIIDYGFYYDRGIGHFNNKNYKEAKLYFSKIIKYSERKMKIFSLSNINLLIIEEAHFLRAIANYYLDESFDQNGFNVDVKYIKYLDLYNGRINPFFSSFLKVLWYITDGNSIRFYDEVINIISQCLKSNPEAIDEFKKYLIHLPLDFQLLFKFNFY